MTSLEAEFNVLVLYSSKTSAWKLADFGFVSEGSSKNIAMSNLARGSPCYRAPELVQYPSSFTLRVDIWALGCIYHELVTSRKAFLRDLDVEDFANGRRELDIPDADKHIRESKGYYPETLFEMLRVNWLQRPPARHWTQLFAELRSKLERPSFDERLISVVLEINSGATCDSNNFDGEWQCENCRISVRNVRNSI